MTVFHVTPNRNRASIACRGLLTRKSKGKRPAVWLVTADRVEWAILHVSRRHKVEVDDVLVIEVDASELPLKMGPTAGTFYCMEDVGSDRFVGYDEAAVLIRAQAEDSEEFDRWYAPPPGPPGA